MARASRGFLRMLHQRAPDAGADLAGVDEEARQADRVALWLEPVEAQDRTVALGDEMGMLRDVVRRDRQRRAAARHEGGVVTPVRLRPQREPGQRRGFRRLGMTDAKVRRHGCAVRGRAPPRRSI